MPPVIGAAIGSMMSEPTPVVQRSVTSAGITTLTVISVGRKRRTDPAIVVSRISASVSSGPVVSSIVATWIRGSAHRGVEFEG